MDLLHLYHLVFLSVWAGIVVTETVVELVGRDARHVVAAAAMHYWIDVLLELPTIAGVVVTGTLLSLRAWPLSPLHWLKIGAALVAIALNLYCMVLVVLRHRSDEPLKYRRRIQVSVLGAPFALVAAYIGFHYFT